MKLHELGAQRPTEQVAKTLEAFMGDRVRFDRLSETQARHMLGRVQGLLKEYKTSVSRHYSERNPDYLKLVMMEQALNARLDEKYMGFKKTAAAVAKGGSARDPEAVAAAIGRKKYGKEKFQKAAAAGKKLGEEQLDELSPDTLNSYIKKAVRKAGNYNQELGKYGDKWGDLGPLAGRKEVGIKRAADKLTAKAKGEKLGENRRDLEEALHDAPYTIYMDGKPKRVINDYIKATEYAEALYARTGNKTIKVKNQRGEVEMFFNESRRKLREASDVQQAQVVMAAQDMVDQIQKMMEQISSMQFKDLPALVDAIKNEVGVDQANRFQADATGALSSLLQAVQGGKTQMEQAQGILTGQAPTVPGADAGADMGAAAPLPAGEPGAEVDADLSLDANLPPPEEEEGGEAPAASLGRERR